MSEDIETLDEYVIAPQHGHDLVVLDPYIIEGVAYSPNKMTYKCNYDEGDLDLELRCDSCDWTTTLGELPEDAGRVQPDLCPDCAKRSELGFVRCESPADGTFPSGWSKTDD